MTRTYRIYIDTGCMYVGDKVKLPDTLTREEVVCALQDALLRLLEDNHKCGWEEVAE